MMNKLLVFLGFALFFSCNKKSDMKEVFITNKSEYWKYNDDCQSHGVYFKFNEKGSYDKYNRCIDDGFELFNNDGDLLSSSRTWSIKNDSIFLWDNEEYKIEKYNTQQIKLSYHHYKEKDKKCIITLSKVK
jgi:hypothetical protein